LSGRETKPIQEFWGDSQGVDCSWSQCFKSHHAQTCPGHGLQLSHSLCQAILEPDNIRGILPGIRTKRTGLFLKWSKVLFSDESRFCISFENQGPRVWRKRGEAQNPSCLKSSVKFPQSVMICGTMSSAGVGPLCFIKSIFKAAVYQEILEHFMLPSADKLYGEADFLFQQDLAPAHSAKTTGNWFSAHGITVLDWPANWPDLNLIQNLWGIVKRKMRSTRPNSTDKLKAAIKATWASTRPQQRHRLIASLSDRIDAVIFANGSLTKY